MRTDPGYRSFMGGLFAAVVIIVFAAISSGR